MRNAFVRQIEGEAVVLRRVKEGNKITDTATDIWLVRSRGRSARIEVGGILLPGYLRDRQVRIRIEAADNRPLQLMPVNQLRTLAPSAHQVRAVKQLAKKHEVDYPGYAEWKANLEAGKKRNQEVAQEILRILKETGPQRAQYLFGMSHAEEKGMSYHNFRELCNRLYLQGKIAKAVERNEYGSPRVAFKFLPLNEINGVVVS